jgi:hypothetical protein
MSKGITKMSGDCPARADNFIPKADLDTKNIDLHTTNEVDFPNP